MDNNTILVRWVSKLNHNEELARKEVPMDKKGRINLKQLCKEWFIKNPYWIEVGEKLEHDYAGMSTITFNFCPEIVITADQIGRNTKNVVKNIMSPKKEKVFIKSTTSKPVNVSSVSHVKKQEAPKTTQPSQSTKKFTLEDLEKLAQLKDAGILSEEEFQEKKAKILMNL